MQKGILMLLLLATAVLVIVIRVFLWPHPAVTGQYVRQLSNDILVLHDTISVHPIDDSDNISYSWTRRVRVDYIKDDAPDKYEVTSGSAALDTKRNALLVDDSEDVWVFDQKRGVLLSGANTYRLMERQ